MGSLGELGAPGFDASLGHSYPRPTVVLPNRATFAAICNTCVVPTLQLTAFDA